EADVLTTAIENYCKRTGHYPERVLVDQIYRNRKNIAFCKSKNIRISGTPLGRPKKNPSPEERKTAHQDNTDRIEVERGFSLAKRCFGMGLICTKLDITTRSSIMLSIVAMNLSSIARELLRFLLSAFHVGQMKLAWL
ncbi:MAG: transposase, partial [Alphaproteobacteria bacterium]|nr:transposase [Alphaproteobacteria bacterium]